MAATKIVNDRKIRLFGLVSACYLVLCMILAACVTAPINRINVTPLTSTSMVIYSSMTRNYNGTHGVLNIYVDADGWPNVLTPVSGQEKTELTATLWLMIVGHPESYTSFQVYSGQTISFEGFDIQILRIAEDKKVTYFVEVEVTES